jgi:putative transposase
MITVADLIRQTNTKAACAAFNLPRATYYRQTANLTAAKPTVRLAAPPLALTIAEEQKVLDVLHEPRFHDHAPSQVYATLLDEGIYYCSIRTMYRILTKHDEVRERRRQVTRPHYDKPELLANGPNQVWSWDITKLKGPAKWTYFHLYVILDIFSRYVVGWMVAHREQAVLAKRLINDSCDKQQIKPDQLTLHADRGSSMKSKHVAFLLADLGVTKTHNRPYVSNDNPFSEAQFKTLKYCPEFPGTFGSIQDARQFCHQFFTWYNNEHMHSSLGLLTPEQIHYCLDKEVIQKRADVLKTAFRKHPNRFKGKIPRPLPAPQEVWINPPKDLSLTEKTK